ncbi:RNA-binding protein P-like [Impatiens glandulifera]|uniref:RNA-binding protein P-like n=1 Tax=Impatiens glandulifera TaxID=253017 RepID=UPI001FB07F9F|nr:RNA-binding protein P-like [Impatiens glandulifera]
MAKNSQEKKRKHPNQQSNININKKKLKKNKIGKSETINLKNKAIVDIQVSDSSSSDDETNVDKFQKHLESYTKEQLIEFAVDAAVNDTHLYSQIVNAADVDISHRKIFVHGLAWDTTDETLRSAFSPYGKIEDCRIVKDRATGKGKGYGFVLFKSRKGATKALKQPSKNIGNRMTSCQLASTGNDSSSRKIYVSNVPSNAERDSLKEFFSKFGEIETGPIGFDTQTGKSRGFALFVYKTLEGAKKALEEPNKVFEDHELHCQKAAEGKNKVSSSGGGAALITTPMHPVQPPVLAAMVAAQNLALLNQQHPGLSQLYNGFITNPNAAAAALFAGGSLNPLSAAARGLGQGSFGANRMGPISGAVGGSNLGAYGASGSQPVIDLYGSSGASTQGLHYNYSNNPSVGLKQPSAKDPISGASFSGYRSYL